MFQNLGGIDRIIRVLIAIGFGVFGVLNISTGLWWVGLIGLVPLLTAFIGICPVYLPFGIKTIHVKKIEK